jgi:acetolactate synthase-1/2/3 large subunit
VELTGGEALVNQLAREGVDKLFVVPGVQLDWATDALRRAQDKITAFIPRHEQATSYMADGYARTTGKIGACMVVPGPGLLNAMAGLATAYACNSRVLCIAGNIHSSGIGKGAGLLHEINRQSDVLSAVTKWNGAARTASEIPALVRQAVRELHTGRPQPVGIEIPHDLLATKQDIPLIDPPDHEDARVRPDGAEIKAVAAVLNAARFPVIYVGGGVLAAGASKQLQALAEKLQAPVVMSENGRGSLSDRHPLALNAVGGRAVFEHADAALIVGSRFVHTTTGRQLVMRPGLKRIYMNADPGIATRNSDATFILADAALGLDALTGEVQRRPSTVDLGKVREWVRNQTSKLEPQTRWMNALRTTIPDDGILVSELTQIGYFARDHYEVYEPNTIIPPGYQGTLGYGFPTALGAAVGANGRAVVSITGDGGFGWSLQELATAARYNLKIVVIVFNDGRFGNVRTLQMAQFGAAFGDTIRNPDFSKLSDAFGVRYAMARGPEELASVLKSALNGDGPSLIEAPVSEMPNPWHLTRLCGRPFPAGTPPNPLGEPAVSG